MENPSDLFGEYVFNDSMMQKRLPKETYKALKRTIEQGRSLDPAVAGVVAKENGNIIKLEHNQFVNINRQAGVELKVTLEAFGHEHKAQIMAALKKAGYAPAEIQTGEVY